MNANKEIRCSKILHSSPMQHIVMHKVFLLFVQNFKGTPLYKEEKIYKYEIILTLMQHKEKIKANKQVVTHLEIKIKEAHQTLSY